MTWPTTTLGELVEFQRGHDLPVQSRVDGPVPVVGSNGKLGSHDTAKYPGPGVMIGRSGVIGGSIYVDGPYWPLNTTLFVKDFRGTHPRWLYYMLKTIDFQGYNSGSVQPSLNRNYIGSIEVPEVPLLEQARIADALRTLDAKIESNEAVIDLLEQSGSALLASHLKLDQAGDPQWDERRMESFVAVLETGSRPRGGLKSGVTGVVSLGAQHVQSAGVCVQREYGHVPLEFANSMRRGKLEDADVLVYKDGGKPGNFIPHISAFGFGFPVSEAVINEHVYRARGASGVSQALLYWVLRSPWLDLEMRRRGTGVAIPGLNSSNFRELPFPAIEDSAREALNSVLTPMLERMLRLGSENKCLADLRDTLLPELISGRMRIEGAA